MDTAFWTRQFSIGDISFSLSSVVTGLSLLLIVLLLQAWLKRLLARRVFPRFGLGPGIANAYATLIGYVFLILGLSIILPIALVGFNLTTLSVVLGAASIGIGFGLRNIADNFVSGLILLFERPIKVGDRIQMEDVTGEIVQIRGRSTTVRTNDNIEIIVPNSQFISERVINWSHNDEKVRFRIPVGVHYKSDVREVEAALIRAAERSPHVLSDPPPSGKFLAFGESSFDFELWVFTDSMNKRPRAFISELNFLIWDSLKESGIEIPYPQRDVYIKEAPNGGIT